MVSLSMHSRAWIFMILLLVTVIVESNNRRNSSQSVRNHTHPHHHHHRRRHTKSYDRSSLNLSHRTKRRTPYLFQKVTVPYPLFDTRSFNLSIIRENKTFSLPSKRQANRNPRAAVATIAKKRKPNRRHSSGKKFERKPVSNSTDRIDTYSNRTVADAVFSKIHNGTNILPSAKEEFDFKTVRFADSSNDTKTLKSYDGFSFPGRTGSPETNTSFYNIRVISPFVNHNQTMTENSLVELFGNVPSGIPYTDERMLDTSYNVTKTNDLVSTTDLQPYSNSLNRMFGIDSKVAVHARRKRSVPNDRDEQDEQPLRRAEDIKDQYLKSLAEFPQIVLRGEESGDKLNFDNRDKNEDEEVGEKTLMDLKGPVPLNDIDAILDEDLNDNAYTRVKRNEETVDQQEYPTLSNMYESNNYLRDLEDSFPQSNFEREDASLMKREIKERHRIPILNNNSHHSQKFLAEEDPSAMVNETTYSEPELFLSEAFVKTEYFDDTTKPTQTEFDEGESLLMTTTENFILIDTSEDRQNVLFDHNDLDVNESNSSQILPKPLSVTPHLFFNNYSEDTQRNLFLTSAPFSKRNSEDLINDDVSSLTTEKEIMENKLYSETNQAESEYVRVKREAGHLSSSVSSEKDLIVKPAFENFSLESYTDEFNDEISASTTENFLNTSHTYKNVIHHMPTMSDGDLESGISLNNSELSQRQLASELPAEQTSNLSDVFNAGDSEAVNTTSEFNLVENFDGTGILQAVHANNLLRDSILKEANAKKGFIKSDLDNVDDNIEHITTERLSEARTNNYSNILTVAKANIRNGSAKLGLTDTDRKVYLSDVYPETLDIVEDSMPIVELVRKKRQRYGKMFDESSANVTRERGIKKRTGSHRTKQSGYPEDDKVIDSLLSKLDYESLESVNDEGNVDAHSFEYDGRESGIPNNLPENAKPRWVNAQRTSSVFKNGHNLGIADNKLSNSWGSGEFSVDIKRNGLSGSMDYAEYANLKAGRHKREAQAKRIRKKKKRVGRKRKNRKKIKNKRHSEGVLREGDLSNRGVRDNALETQPRIVNGNSVVEPGIDIASKELPASNLDGESNIALYANEDNSLHDGRSRRHEENVNGDSRHLHRPRNKYKDASLDRNIQGTDRLKEESLSDSDDARSRRANYFDDTIAQDAKDEEASGLMAVRDEASGLKVDSARVANNLSATRNANEAVAPDEKKRETSAAEKDASLKTRDRALLSLREAKMRVKRNGKARNVRGDENGVDDRELKYYEDVREPVSASAARQKQDKSSISRGSRGERAVRSVEDIKELAESLVAKVNELQSYLSTDRGRKTGQQKRANVPCAAATVDRRAADEPTARLVKHCVVPAKPAGANATSNRSAASAGAADGNSAGKTKRVAERSDARSGRLSETRDLMQKRRSGTSPGEPAARTANDRSKRRSNNKWDRWTDWSSCSVTCGRGRQIRWRHCVRDCNTAETEMEEKSCQLPACPPGKFLGIF